MTNSRSSSTIDGTPGLATIAEGDPEITETFTLTGSPEVFTVPAEITSVDIVACGAQGGDRGGRG